LGEDYGVNGVDHHVLQQYSKITGKNGNNIIIDPPINYVSPNPTGQSVRKQTMTMYNAGVENMRLNGNGSNYRIVQFYFARNCWAKGVETYNVQSTSGSAHIETNFSFQCEIRDCCVHHESGNNASGQNYGIGFYWWNSNHKVENNIAFDTRHAIIFEGGGSGCAILYNYGLNNYEDDRSALSESFVSNHGAHPHMNLWEGNIDQQFSADYTQGSSSHNTWFRNWALGYRASPSGYSIEAAMRVGPYNRYYNLVGNVAGMSTWSSGVAICNGSSCAAGNFPHAFEFGFHTDGSYLDSASYSTAVLQGNYDYITDGVAVWSDSDHVLANSMYYAAKPAWYAGCTWPPVDPTNGYVADTPAKLRYEGSSCVGSMPSAPKNLRIIQ
jgi:hypothetical protein